MSAKQTQQLIQQLENYTECWKQFNYFVNLARSKKFGGEDEAQFLEVKTVMIQQLEVILASIESGTPTKDDVLNLISAAPSLRYVGEMNDSSVRNLESQWHKLYICWHSVLGQLKVRRSDHESKSFFAGLLEKK